MKLDEAIENTKQYELGYRHGLLAVNELVESLQSKLAQARSEVARLQEVINERRAYD